MKVVTIIGTRPEFIQVGPLTNALRHSTHTEILVNTGQHYDDNMSELFFRELNLPQPDYNLAIGSGSHAQQTGHMMMRIEEVLFKEEPDCVIVYGDTNSTVAGALVASKLNMPVVHVESGLRSFDRNMPEEINRVITDHISCVLFAPTDKAIQNLKKEGIVNGVHNVGDVRVDVLHDIQERSEDYIMPLLKRLAIPSDSEFILATIHRAENTDQEARLRHILSIFRHLDLPVVLPVHPRLSNRMEKLQLEFSDNVHAIDPIGFFDMMTLLSACKLVVTDSGGLQKEAYMLKRPTITLRDSTEWTETVDSGWNRLCSPDLEEFQTAYTGILDRRPDNHPGYYGEYGVGKRMLAILESTL